MVNHVARSAILLKREIVLGVVGGFCIISITVLIAIRQG